MKIEERIKLGARLEKAIRRDVKNLTQLCRDMRQAHGTLYNHFKGIGMDWELIGKYVKQVPSIKIDFPDLPVPMVHTDNAKDPEAVYESKLLNDCIQEKNDFKNRYYKLLEDYTTLLRAQQRV